MSPCIIYHVHTLIYNLIVFTTLVFATFHTLCTCMHFDCELAVHNMSVCNSQCTYTHFDWQLVYNISACNISCIPCNHIDWQPSTHAWALAAYHVQTLIYNSCLQHLFATFHAYVDVLWLYTLWVVPTISTLWLIASLQHQRMQHSMHTLIDSCPHNMSVCNIPLYTLWFGLELVNNVGLL